MKKIIHWKRANKLAIVFGIIGGLYLIYQLVLFIASDKLNFNSEITINDFNYPHNNSKYSFYKQARNIISSNFEIYDLSRNITDTLYKNLDLSEFHWFTIRNSIENAIPKEIDRSYLIDKIDSLILEETYPMRETSCYVESFIKNEGDRIAKELRFELPANGFYELYINESFVNSGNFQDHIFIDELRPENIASLRIWSFKHLSDYYIFYTKQIKYTFDNGFIVPTILVPIRTEGFFYWIYKNPIWAFYFLLWLPLYITFVVARNWKKKDRSSEPTEDKKTTHNN